MRKVSKFSSLSYDERWDTTEATLERDVKRASRALEQHIRLTFDSIRLMLPELNGKSSLPRENGNRL